jgi:hypothetical protein
MFSSGGGLAVLQGPDVFESGRGVGLDAGVGLCVGALGLHGSVRLAARGFRLDGTRGCHLRRGNLHRARVTHLEVHHRKISRALSPGWAGGWGGVEGVGSWARPP